MMPGNNTHEKKRKASVKFKASYSSVTAAEAQKRLGFRFQSVRGWPVHTMLGRTPYEKRKKRFTTAYWSILQLRDILRKPTQITKKSTSTIWFVGWFALSFIVYTIIVPVLNDFIRRTGCEKEIISTDSETGGEEEFVLVDMISVGKENFIFVVESKRSSVGKAMRQCMLAMEDLRDNNWDGKVYGFVTSGEYWQMPAYDGTSFRRSESIVVIFDSMDEDKQRWLDI